MGRRATAHLPLLPQIGEQVTHRQPLAHVLRAELLASWVERSHAILHQAVGQRHIAADHQVTGHGVLHQVVIGRVRAAGHHDQLHAREARLDLALPGHQHHFELALEGELHHLILGRPGAGVCIDPHAEPAATVQHHNRQDRHSLGAQGIGIGVNAQPVEVKERDRPGAEDPGFLQRLDAMPGEYHRQRAQQRRIYAEEQRQRQF
eukprot:gene12308-15043_t